MNGLSKEIVKSFGQVTWQAKDKDGNIKPLFTENKIGQNILKFIRIFVKNPIDESGKVKEGLHNYLAAYGLRIPYLTGLWGDYRIINNLVTNAGFAGIADLIGPQGSSAQYKYLAIGTGTNAASASDTALQTEITTGGGARAAATMSRVTTSVTNDTAQAQLTFTFTSSFAVTESGLLNAASVGTLLCRQTFSAINVVNGDTLQVTWKIQAH